MAEKGLRHFVFNEGFIQEGRNYFDCGTASTPSADCTTIHGLAYEPYAYPHPLVVTGPKAPGSLRVK